MPRRRGAAQVDRGPPHAVVRDCSYGEEEDTGGNSLQVYFPHNRFILDPRASYRPYRGVPRQPASTSWPMNHQECGSLPQPSG